MDQIFRGSPNSPVSLLNKVSICSTGLTPKVSENLSYTTFTINKDNSLTLTPVPKPPATSYGGYYEEPKFHKVEFTPRSTPGLDRMSESHKAESVKEDRREEIDEKKELSNQNEKSQIEYQIQDDGKSKCNSYEVFVPKVQKTYEEYMPNMNDYTEPNRAESRCSLKSPSSFKATKPEQKPQTVIQERSLPVKTLIDTFEHQNRPVMRYLQPEESIPLSENIKHLHDDPTTSSTDNNQVDEQHEVAHTDRENEFYVADTAVETRSFVYEPSQQQPNFVPEENASECADKSGITDRSEYGDRSEYTDDVSLSFDVRSDLKFQTIRQLATPDSLESSMLFAQKQSFCDDRKQEYNNSFTAQRKVQGKTNNPMFDPCTFVEFIT